MKCKFSKNELLKVLFDKIYNFDLPRPLQRRGAGTLIFKFIQNKHLYFKA
jgi:hypothetical protein